MGLTPGPHFKPLLAELNASMPRTRDMAKAEAHVFWSEIIERHRPVPPKHLALHAKPVDLRFNLTAHSPEEEANLNGGRETMELLLRTPTLVAGFAHARCLSGRCGRDDSGGGVVGAQSAIHPGMYSADICCSVMATDFGFADTGAILGALHG